MVLRVVMLKGYQKGSPYLYSSTKFGLEDLESNEHYFCRILSSRILGASFYFDNVYLLKLHTT